MYIDRRYRRLENNIGYQYIPLSKRHCLRILFASNPKKNHNFHNALRIDFLKCEKS